MNRLAIGTAKFGHFYGSVDKQGQVGFDDARAIMQHAASTGVDTLDTAIAYGNSEETLGDIGVSRWRVVSKLPAIPEECADIPRWVEESVRASLGRLRVGQLHGLLLHRPEQLLGAHGDTLYSALNQLKTSGLVRKIGVSIYAPEELNALCARYEFDIVQAPFNVFDRRIVDSTWLQRLLRQGIDVHARSVFLQGLLLTTQADRPEKFDRWRALWSRWQQWLAEHKLSPLQACLRYVMAQRDFERIIVGVDSMDQLEEILQAANAELPDVPRELHCDDINLIDPSRWASL